MTSSYWQRDAGWRDRRAQRSLPRAVDYAVLGGGFAGLATAIHLRQRNPDATVMVLEAERVGFGANTLTGRRRSTAANTASIVNSTMTVRSTPTFSQCTAPGQCSV
jgi:cation diffusion facilitator CzcD-associated flavoprotein CzcO